MKLRYRLITASISAIFFISIYTYVSPINTVTAVETNFAQLVAQAPVELVFAYVEDSPPISGSSSSQHGVVELTGYCKSLFRYLADEKSYSVIPVAIEHGERFQGLTKAETFNSDDEDIATKVASGTFAIECGPNSKNRIRETVLQKVGGTFSETFFTTSTKLLMRKEKIRKLRNDHSNFRIGVFSSGEEACPIRATDQVVTTQVICDIFPTATVIPVSDRKDAIQKLEDDVIDAYTSDEVLLKSIKKDSLDSWKYAIEPSFSDLTREEYGLVLYNSTSVETTAINNWILGEGQAARKNEIEHDFGKSWIQKSLEYIVSLDEIWIILGISFLLIIGLFIFITHPLLTNLFQGNLFLDKMMNRLRKSKGPFGSVVNNYVNIVNNAFYLTDKDLPLKLIEATVIQPRLKRLRGNINLQDIEPEDVRDAEKEKICNDLEEDLSSNNWFQDIWQKTILRHASIRFKERIGGFVGKSVDELWDLGVNKVSSVIQKYRN